MDGLESISNALGWMSIACWAIVYAPQVHENYVLKSGEGRSAASVIVWLLGDITNLAGTALGDLLPTMIYLAAYFLVCDIFLLGQIFWYRYTHPVHPIVPGVIGPNDEETPLLLVQKPVSDKKKSTLLRRLVFYLVMFGFVLGTGYVAWRFDDPGKEKTEQPEWRSQVLGWTSAVLYLGSRIPQIYKNFETKCEGLSLGFFVFAILGNVIYIASILIVSVDQSRILSVLPWLTCNIIAIMFDVFVLCQFFYYCTADPVFLTDGQLEESERNNI